MDLTLRTSSAVEEAKLTSRCTSLSFCWTDLAQHASSTGEKIGITSYFALYQVVARGKMLSVLFSNRCSNALLGLMKGGRFRPGNTAASCVRRRKWQDFRSFIAGYLHTMAKVAGFPILHRRSSLYDGESGRISVPSLRPPYSRGSPGLNPL